MNFWTILLPLILKAASEVLSPWLKPIFPWLTVSAKGFFAQPHMQFPGNSQPTFTAPDDLRKWLSDKLNAFSASLPFPSMKYVVDAIISLLTGTLLDQLWDSLFAAQIVTKPAAAFPKPARSTSHPVFNAKPEADIKKMVYEDCEACCGK